MRNIFFKYVVSTVLGGLLVWLAFKDEDWGGFSNSLDAVRLDLLGLYVLMFLAGHFIRIFRWGVLVRALGPIKWGDVIGAGAVGYMCIIVFPLRLGEFVRPYLIRGKGGVTASGALATVVVERVIDGLLFVALFFVFLSILPPTGDPRVEWVRYSAWVAGAVFLSALVVLIAGYISRNATVRLIRAIGHRVHVGLTEKVVGLVDAFLGGLRVLPDPARIAWFTIYTAAYWALLGGGMTVMGYATGINDMTLSGGFALLAVLVVGIMIPGGPGFTGTFEAALKAGFALLLLSEQSQQQITVYIIVLHAVQLLAQVLVGAIWLITGRVSLKGALSPSEEPAQEPS